ncbi:hypothetical protein [Halorubrum sp. Ea8]|uniref:hypothetical protein n=1 Tax=Halorubrum sp. Ea8 TaxID=1383841 RepID=UPI000B990EF9|nr:hypothetical protein [Halorubrum sp. Ea8]OYR47684.1 hypothetical protein DJ74_12480 [Halorubrum sp. Ea8]
MCIIAFSGSNSSIDPLTETKSLQVGAARHEAIARTYQAETQYQMAAAQDIQGNTYTESTREDNPADYCPLCIRSGASAMESFENTAENAGLARSAWKQAEYRQGELIAHFRSQPDDSGIRPEVRDEMDRLNQMDAVLDRASNSPYGGRLWDQMDVDPGADVVEVCADLLNIDTNRDIGSGMRDREGAWDDIMSMLEMDHHQMGRMKTSVDKLYRSLEDHRDEFEGSKHFESWVANNHLDGKTHPVQESFTQVTDLVTRYSVFFDVMSTSINTAVQGAQGDIPEDHLNSYLDR